MGIREQQGIPLTIATQRPTGKEPQHERDNDL